MSDHGHHDPGGHELEAINTKLLFRLMISLSIVTVLASLAVVQWFYSQRHELETRYAAEGSFQLQEYQAKMDADLEGIDRVAQDLAANPARLQAVAPPSGWTHPDDLVGGGAAVAAPAEHAPEHAPEPANKGDEGLSPEADAAEGADGEGAADEAVEAVEVKAPEPKADEPAKPAKADKPEAEPKPKSNNGKGDENKADKADKPDNG